MSSQQHIRLSKLEQDVQCEEERSVLLGQDVEEFDDFLNADDPKANGGFVNTSQTPRKRNRIRVTCVALLLAATLGLLLHNFLSTHKHKSSSSSSTTIARLRPEEEYILNPPRDFNAVAQTREYHWTIAEHELNPDGVYRRMLLINGMFPGPLIECNEGDELVIHVHNRGSNATSVHWHGLFQNGTNWMDGTVGITQCPIAPGQSFTYRLNVSGQTGTYWYHSHMAMQISDGVVGPIVIHARNGDEGMLQGVPYGLDRVVIVSDHYYDLSSSLLMQYLAPGSENDEPVPPSALINGRGTRDCQDVPNRKCSASGISNALFDLSSDSSTRLRLINAGAFAEFQIQFDEHEFQVTEVDGVDVHPQSIHRLNINPAQRYSIILTRPNQDKDLYWMRARMITHCFAYEEPELKEEVRAVIRYGSSTNLKPESNDWPEIIEVECRDLNTSALEPVEVIAAPKQADDQIYLRSSFQIGDWRLSRGFLNGTSYRPNLTHPTLHEVVSGYSRKETAYLPSVSTAYGFDTGVFDPTVTMVYQTTGIRIIDILIQNFDDGNHPFHLHGHTFFVLAAGHGYPSENLHSSLNLTNPLRRDTASVEAFGWMLIRFVADNPGMWAFHCHIGWHSEAGLLMQFLTRVDEVAKWTVPTEAEGLCADEGITMGAGPDDSIWVGTWD